MSGIEPKYKAAAYPQSSLASDENRGRRYLGNTPYKNVFGLKQMTVGFVPAPSWPNEHIHPTFGTHMGQQLSTSALPFVIGNACITGVASPVTK